METQDFTFDGFGFNSTAEYAPRLCTLTPEGQSQGFGQHIMNLKARAEALTVDILIKRYWDGKNGNSYFAGRVILNYGAPSEVTLYLKYQYGYGESAHMQAAREVIQEKTGLQPDLSKVTLRYFLWEKCPKRDCIRFGTDPYAPDA